MFRSLKSAVALVACLAAGAVVAPLATSEATPVAAAAPRPDQCGAKVAKAKGFWSCTLADNFSGTALDRSVWTGITQPGHSDPCMLDDPRTIAVSDGSLRLTALQTGDGLQCPLRADGTRAPYAGAWASTYYRWGQQYGRFEARIKVQVAEVQGLHEAFWLWPDTRFTADTPWPSSGEIDIVETFSSHPNLAVPYLHYGENDNGGPVPGLNTAWDCTAPRGQWHTYVLEWTADKLTIFVDGQTCLVNTAGASSFRKPFIINLTQFLGGAQNLFDGRAPLPATMEVDYVKVWK